MKSLPIIALLIAGALSIPVKAEDGIGSADSTNAVITHSPQKRPNASFGRSPQTSDDGSTITVDVWSAAAPAQDQPQEENTAKLSSSFALAGLNAANRMQNTERRMEQSIKRGFPLGEFWIRLDFDGIDDSLRVASLSVRNDADRQALQRLQAQVDRLRSWSNWLIQQNRELRLADYYISPAKLDNDEQFQASVSCTNFLLSMMASSRLQEEDRSCR